MPATVTRQQFFTAASQLGDVNDIYTALSAEPGSAAWIEFYSGEFVEYNDPLSLVTQAAYGFTDTQMVGLFNTASVSPVPVAATAATITRQQFFSAISASYNMDLLYQNLPSDANDPSWIEFWSATNIARDGSLALLAQSTYGWSASQLAEIFAYGADVVTPGAPPIQPLNMTAGDQINGALRLLGVLAEGETPSAATSQDALFALNQMIDSWNTERLAVYSTQDQMFLWPSGQKSMSLGPTGDFAGNRPILLDDSTYFRDPQTNVSYGIKFINQQQYDGIAVKTVTSTYPQVMFINMTYPNIEMVIYPVPLRLLEWHFISVEQIMNPVTLSTAINLPPGYLRAFRYNLACELAPEFGVEPSVQVQRIAMYSKRNLKRINNPDDVMALPYSIVGTRQRYNIYAGNY